MPYYIKVNEILMRDEDEKPVEFPNAKAADVVAASLRDQDPSLVVKIVFSGKEKEK
jgi:hypothetical protein